MPKKIRGQAALEYLLTYGWALVAMAVVLGSLLFLTSNAVSPSNCQMNPSSGAITYKDSYIVSGKPINIYLRNDSGKTISDVNLSFSGSFSTLSPSLSNGPYTSAQEFMITAGVFPLSANTNYSGNISITYKRNNVIHISTLYCTGSA
jgi:hypothetical protein